MKESVENRLLAPVDAEVSARIAWLIQLRWLAIVGALVAITVANALLAKELPTVQLVGLVAFISLYNVVFYLYAHILRQEPAPAASRRSLAK